MSVSGFVCYAVANVMPETEAELARADEERARKERIADLAQRTEGLVGNLADTPLARMPDGEVTQRLEGVMLRTHIDTNIALGFVIGQDSLCVSAKRIFLAASEERLEVVLPAMPLVVRRLRLRRA